MIEGIGIALKSYYDTVTTAKSVLEKAMEQIRENYIGATLAEKTKEAQDTFNTTMNECKDNNYNACVAVLDEVHANALKVVEMPVPTDFTATLEALKQMKNPTAREVETVVGAYKNNYFAYRAICDYLKVTDRGIRPVTIDDIESDIASIRQNVRDCIYRDNIDGYHFMNWMNGTILASYDEVFTAFIDGRFEEIVKQDDDTKEDE